MLFQISLKPCTIFTHSFIGHLNHEVLKGGDSTSRICLMSLNLTLQNGSNGVREPTQSVMATAHKPMMTGSIPATALARAMDLMINPFLDQDFMG